MPSFSCSSEKRQERAVHEAAQGFFGGTRKRDEWLAAERKVHWILDETEPLEMAWKMAGEGNLQGAEHAVSMARNLSELRRKAEEE